MSYMSKYLKPTIMNTIVTKVVNDLSPRSKEFDGFLVTGLSGITIGSVVAYVMKKDLYIIRKNIRSTHSLERIETPYLYGEDNPSKRVLILDDRVETGKTIKKIVKTVEEHKELPDSKITDMDIIGVYLYHDNKFALNYTLYKELKVWGVGEGCCL